MDLVFNELSIQPLAKDKTEAFTRVNQILLTFKRANEFNYNKIRFHKSLENIELSNNYSLSEFCKEPQNRTKATLLWGLFKYPFIDENSKEESQYIQNNFCLKKGEELIESYGLAAAYLYSIPGIGFCSEPFWGNCKFEIIITGENEICDTVFCVSKPEHFDIVDLINWHEQKLIKSLDPKETIAKLFPGYIFESKAIEDFFFWKKDGLITKRLLSLLKDISFNPFIGGLGKTESLRCRVNTYAKRIDEENRLVYLIESNMQITILSCRGHYDD